MTVRVVVMMTMTKMMTTMTTTTTKVLHDYERSDVVVCSLFSVVS